MKHITFFILLLLAFVGTAHAQDAAGWDITVRQGGVNHRALYFDVDPSAWDSLKYVVYDEEGGSVESSWSCQADSEVTCTDTSVVILIAVADLSCDASTCYHELQRRQSGFPAHEVLLAGALNIKAFGEPGAISSTSESYVVTTGDATITITDIAQATSLSTAWILGLTELVTGADGDLFALYDSSAGAWKSFDYNNLPSGGAGTDDQTAAEVPSTPTGDIAATNTQDAIAELEAEKLAKSDTTGLMFTETRAVDALSDADGFAVIPPQLRVASVSALNGSTSLISASGKGQVYLERYAATDSLGVGSGWLYADTADGTTADDGCRVFVDGSGVRWKRPYPASLIRADDCGFSPTSTDDNAAAIDRMQDAMTAYGAGATWLFDEPGTYQVALEPHEANNASFVVDEDFTTVFVASGVTIKRPDGWDGSGSGDWHLFKIEADNVTVRGEGLNSILNGNHGASSDAPGSFSQQAHLLYVNEADNVTVENLYLTNDAGAAQEIGEGDCIFLRGTVGNTSLGIRIAGNHFIECGRSGIANQGYVERVQVAGNFFEGTGDQDIDFEPTSGTLHDYIISGNTIVHASATHAVTIGGLSSSLATGLVFSGNTLTGGSLLITDVADMHIAGNVIEHLDGTAIQLSQRFGRVRITGGSATGAGEAVIKASSSIAAADTSALYIDDINITSLADTTIGVLIEGVRVASLSNVALRGAGLDAGIQANTTLAQSMDFSMQGGRVDSFAVGVDIAASSGVVRPSISGVTFIDATTAIQLAESSSTIEDVSITGNRFLSGVTTEISGVGTAVDFYRLAGSETQPSVITITADPESSLDAPRGTLALCDDGGCGTYEAYLKETAAGTTTGWAGIPGAGGGTDDQTAGEVPYTAFETNDWPNADPTDIGAAADSLAERVTALEAGGSGGSDTQVLSVGAEAVPSAGQTRYILARGAFETTAVRASVPIGAGTAENLHCASEVAPGSGHSLTITAMKQTSPTGTAAAQAVTCTISDTGTECTDTANSAAFAADDLLSLRVVASGSAPDVGRLKCSIEIDKGAGGGAGGSAGTLNTIKEDDAAVGGSDIVTLDFGTGFDLAESPDTEIQISVDASELESSFEAVLDLPDLQGNLTESRISDLAHTTDTRVNIKEANVEEQADATDLDFDGTDFDVSCTTGECDVTINNAGLSVTESQISDLSHTTDTDFSDTATHEQIPFDRSDGVAGTDSLKWDGSAGTLLVLGDITVDGASVQTGTDDDVPESGDFGNAADLDATGALSDDVVAAAEMADADHGDVSWSAGVATVDNVAKASVAGAPTGDFVGTSDTQTLTNKTIDGDDNTLQDIPVSALASETRSFIWPAGAMVSDGTNCAAPATNTIGTNGPMYTVICTDNDGSTIYGDLVMLDSWDGSTMTFELTVIQDAADTSNLQGDISAQCRGDGETTGGFGTEVALDIDTLTGSDAIDQATSASVTPTGTCAAGDWLQWRWQMDATGTTTAVATLNIVGMKIEYTSTIGD